jgi:hypothetical protein
MESNIHASSTSVVRGGAGQDPNFEREVSRSELIRLTCTPCTRFRKVPTFGRGTIRSFGNNVSAMKQLAGRDFEDILQVMSLMLIFRFRSSMLTTSKVHYSCFRGSLAFYAQRDCVRSLV